MITQLHLFDDEEYRNIGTTDVEYHFEFPEINLFNNDIKYNAHPYVWKLDVHSRLVSTLIDEKIFMRYLLKRYLK